MLLLRENEFAILILHHARHVVQLTEKVLCLIARLPRIHLPQQIVHEEVHRLVHERRSVRVLEQPYLRAGVRTATERDAPLRLRPLPLIISGVGISQLDKIGFCCYTLCNEALKVCTPSEEEAGPAKPLGAFLFVDIFRVALFHLLHKPCVPVFHRILLAVHTGKTIHGIHIPPRNNIEMKRGDNSRPVVVGQIKHDDETFPLRLQIGLEHHYRIGQRRRNLLQHLRRQPVFVHHIKQLLPAHLHRQHIRPDKTQHKRCRHHVHIRIGLPLSGNGIVHRNGERGGVLLQIIAVGAGLRRQPALIPHILVPRVEALGEGDNLAGVVVGDGVGEFHPNTVTVRKNRRHAPRILTIVRVKIPSTRTASLQHSRHCGVRLCVRHRTARCVAHI